MKRVCSIKGHDPTALAVAWLLPALFVQGSVYPAAPMLNSFIEHILGLGCTWQRWIFREPPEEGVDQRSSERAGRGGFQLPSLRAQPAHEAHAARGLREQRRLSVFGCGEHHQEPQPAGGPSWSRDQDDNFRAPLVQGFEAEGLSARLHPVRVDADLGSRQERGDGFAGDSISVAPVHGHASCDRCEDVWGIQQGSCYVFDPVCCGGAVESLPTVPHTMSFTDTDDDQEVPPDPRK